MKRTILSEKELQLLENLISSYGYIVDFKQIESKLRISHQAVRNLVAKLVRSTKKNYPSMDDFLFFKRPGWGKWGSFSLLL